MRTLLAAVALTLVTASGAAADVFDDCRAAVRTSDAESARAASTRILFGNGIYVPPDETETVGQCLELGGKTGYAYSRATGTFVSIALAEAQNRRLEAREERKRLEDEKAQAAVELIEQERRARQMREAAVRTQVQISCENLYRLAPDTTITNGICLEVFLRDGLPD